MDFWPPTAVLEQNSVLDPHVGLLDRCLASSLPSWRHLIGFKPFFNPFLVDFGSILEGIFDIVLIVFE